MSCPLCRIFLFGLSKKDCAKLSTWSFIFCSGKTLNAWNKPFAALIIRNQGKRLYKAQGRISGLFSFTFFSAKKEKKAFSHPDSLLVVPFLLSTERFMQSKYKSLDLGTYKPWVNNHMRSGRNELHGLLRLMWLLTQVLLFALKEFLEHSITYLAMKQRIVCRF